MSVKFCPVCRYKSSWYLLATSQPTNLLVRAVYRFHVYFHIRLISHELGISLPYEDGFVKVKNATLRVHITVSVMTMALMQMKHGCMGIGYIQRIMVFSVMK